MQTVSTSYKLMILFMLQNAEKPLSNSFILDYILEQENNDYFRLQEAVSDLEEGGLIDKNVIGNRSYYQITESGSETLSYMQPDLPDSVRKNILNHLKMHHQELRHEILTPADLYPTGQGTACTVRCRIIEDGTQLLDISLTMPSKEAALAVCRSWPMKSQTIYEKLMEELL